MIETHTVSEEVKIKIVKEYVEPAYEYDIKNMIKGKRCWKVVGQCFETISKILIAASGILSFSSGYYQEHTLSFLAGSVSTISLAMLQFSSFSFKENKKQSDELNILLKKLGLDTIPVFDRNAESQGLSKQLGMDQKKLSDLFDEIKNKSDHHELKDSENVPDIFNKIYNSDEIMESKNV